MKNSSEDNERDVEKHEVSEAWRKKFMLLEEAGADSKSLYRVMSSPEFKALGFRDKQRISFNAWGFVFGPLYYFFKKMWGKGALLLALMWLISALLSLLEVIFGISLPQIVYWVPGAVICAQLASHDYYRKVVHEETMWPGIPDFFSRPLGLALAPIGALALLFGLYFLTPEFSQEMENQQLEDVSGVWSSDYDNSMIQIDFRTSGQSNLTVNGEFIPVRIAEVDQDNAIVAFNLTLNGQQHTWSLRQIFQENNYFTLQLTLHDGSREPLSFVRNL